MVGRACSLYPLCLPPRRCVTNLSTFTTDALDALIAEHEKWCGRFHSGDMLPPCTAYLLAGELRDARLAGSVIIALTAELAQYKEANQTMHDAFMEVRAKLNAWDTPHAPSTEVIVACVSRHLDELVAERDALLEDIKERDRTYLAVQQADGLEREKVEAERDALIEALQALVDEQNGPPLLKDVEYWEAAMNQAGEALGVIRTPIPPSVFSSEQARKEIEKRHIEPLTPETHSHGKAEPANSGAV